MNLKSKNTNLKVIYNEFKIITKKYENNFKRNNK